MKLNRSYVWYFATMLFLSATWGCVDDYPPIEDPIYDSRISSALVSIEGCDAVTDQLKKVALTEMNRELDENLKIALKERERYGSSWECHLHFLEHGGNDESAAPMYDSGMMSDSSSSYEPDDDEPKDVSGTNNQVASVDEADFLKNDKQHIYLLHHNKLQIFKAWPADQTQVIAEVAIDGNPRKLFVHNDRIVVYSAIASPKPSCYDEYNCDEPSYYSPLGECTYGYDCDFVGDGSATKISIFDITDRTAPKLTREITLSTSLISARRIDNAVYTVTSTSHALRTHLEFYPDDLSECASKNEIRTAFESLRERNRTTIEQTDFSSIIPQITETLHGVANEQPRATTNTSSACHQKFYRTGLSDGTAFTSVLAFDLSTSDSPLHSATILSRPGAVYASEQSLYLAVRHEFDPYWGWYEDMEDTKETSTLHRFSLDSTDADVTYTASGIFKGHVLNQFSMDEHKGVLRVASSVGWVPDPNVHSVVTVFETVDKKLVAVGQIDKLAPSEDIRAVRFDGDRGYVVTFKKTDPLFVFDLSEPNNPKKVGELKIPGFSTYMHKIDDNHLLSIGYDADDQGDFAYFTGVQLQLFDVSDLSAPKLIHKEVIGTRGSSSEALTNHLAFTYFPSRNALALPMTICESQSEDYWNAKMTFSGLMVYDVTIDGGFKLKGKVSHAMPKISNDYGDYYDESCQRWWTSGASAVKRSLFMDDFVYSISDDHLKVNHLAELDQDLVSLPLGQ